MSARSERRIAVRGLGRIGAAGAGLLSKAGDRLLLYAEFFDVASLLKVVFEPCGFGPFCCCDVVCVERIAKGNLDGSFRRPRSSRCVWGGRCGVKAEHLFNGDTKRAGKLARFLLMGLKLGGLAALEFCLKPVVEVEEFVEGVGGQFVRFRGLRALL